MIEQYDGNHTKILHKCKVDGHQWLAQPANILSGEGCPVCGRKSTTAKQRQTHQDYLDKISKINKNISVIEKYVNSDTKILHKCNKCGYEWNTRPYSILQGYGCPKCASILKKTHDDYVFELFNINPNIEVCGTYINAKTSILHKCKIDNYEWMAKPLNTLRGQQCPVCTGKAILNGYNDIATLYPDLTAEWDYELNQGLQPYEFGRGSNSVVWWKCGECGDSYKSRISNRIYNNSSCPKCNNQSSNAEIKVYYYIKKYFEDAINRYHDKNITELDVYIPSLNIGIEYDGTKWHSDINRDKLKDKTCQELGIKLIRIREYKCPQYESSCSFIYLNDHKIKTFEDAITKLLLMCGIKEPRVNFKEDHAGIYQLIFNKKIKNSVALMSPHLLDEWDTVKNGNADPYKIAYKSDKHMWWRCTKCGREWYATINSRSSGCGCPKCSRKKKE